MSDDKQQKDDDIRLGHDPLEWLDEEELDPLKQALTDPDEEAPMETPQDDASEQAVTDEEPESDEEPAVAAYQEEVAPEIKAEAAEQPTEAGEVVPDVAAMEQPEAIETEAAPQSNDLTLPEKLVINDIEQLYKQWYDFLLAHQGERLRIHSSSVELIDAAGLQLLLVFIKTATEEGFKKVKLEDCSKVLVNSIEHAGMKEHFNQYSTGDMSAA